MKRNVQKLISLVLALAFCLGLLPAVYAADDEMSETADYAASEDTVKLTGTTDYTAAEDVVALMNAAREETGVPDLTMDAELLDAAMQRAAECALNFNYTRPNGADFSELIDGNCSENLALGESSAAEVMEDWMAASPFRNVILTEDYTRVGIGCFTHNGMTYWVSLFGCGDAEPVSKSGSLSETFTIEVDRDMFPAGMSISSADEVTLSYGETMTCKASILNTAFITYEEDRLYYGLSALPDASSLNWTSSNTSVATVDSSGKITAVSGGSATITAASSGGALSAGVKVTVELGTPVLKSISNVDGGVKLTWEKVSGATKYRVFRKTSGGSWTKVADTSSTGYTDKTAKSGTTYSYTVRCLTADGSSYAGSYDSSGLRISYIAAPSLKSIAGSSSGIKITWDKSSGAVKYRVFRKTGSGSWKKLADVSSSETSYTDKTAKAGTTYTYTVRCIASDGSYASSYNAAGLQLKYAAKPTLDSISGTASGVKLTWNKSSGAVNYKVFRKTGSGSWTALGTTTGTSFTDKTAKAGTTYTYTVRPVTSDGKAYAGGYDKTGLTLKYAATPTLGKLTAGSSGVKITWNKATGAAKYRVFRKTGSGSWKKLADVSSSTLSYTDKTAKAGTSYTYTVRCITSDGKAYAGGYDSTGLSVTYAAAPKLGSVSGTGSGVKITWSKATGAVNYKVFRKTDGGSWKGLGTTTGTSFTDKTAQAGTSYTYTVRPITANGKYYAGGYDSKGLTLQYAATPTLTGITGSDSGVKITWSEATGAVNYKVFRKTDGGSWTALGTTTGTSFTDKTAEIGTDYIYTVRPVTANGKYYAGGYDKSGLRMQRAATPKLTGVSQTDEGVCIKWSAAAGAERYKVFRKTGNESWTALGTTTDTSFTDTTALAGVTYTYTVRCITSDGKHYAGSYDKAGQSITTTTTE